MWGAASGQVRAPQLHLRNSGDTGDLCLSREATESTPAPGLGAVTERSLKEVMSGSPELLAREGE